MRKALLSCFVVVAVAFIAFVAWLQSGDPPAVEQAKAIVTKASATPSTIKWARGQVLASERAAQGEHRMAFLSYDEQNAFGAMLRHNVCVSFLDKGAEYTWRRVTAMRPCSDPPTPDEIESAKGLNDWPSVASRAAK